MFQTLERLSACLPRLVLTTVLIFSERGELRAEPEVPAWNLAALERPPKWEALSSPAARSPNIRAVFFTGPDFRGKETRVFAWLGVPSAQPGEKVPGVVLVHGGGGTAFEGWVRMWVERGYAAIALDTCGQVPVGNYGNWLRDAQGGPPGWGGFDQLDSPRTEQWTYHAVADIVLAHSLLRSLPEVDAERTGITGISWGGYLTCIAAGVDARFKFAAPVYGCGFYAETVFAGQLNALNSEQRERWLTWWDASVHLPRAEMPFLWVSGAKDHFYPLAALQKSSRLPRGERTLAIRAAMRHGQGDGERPEEIRVFADSILKRGQPLTRITSQGGGTTNLWAVFASQARVVKAELNFTLSTGDRAKREWKQIPATITGDKAEALLPEDARAYFLNLIDERGCVVSTDAIER